MTTLRQLLVRNQVLVLGAALSALVIVVWVVLSQLAWHNAETRTTQELRQVEILLTQRFSQIEQATEAMCTLWSQGDLDPAQAEDTWRRLHPWVRPIDHLTGVNLVRKDGRGFGLGRIGDEWGGRGLEFTKGRWLFGPVIGTTRESTGRQPGMDFRHRPWFQAGRQRQQGFWMEPFLFAGRREGEPGLTFVRPVHRDGQFLGVISLDLLLESVTEVVWSARPTVGASLMVVDTQNRIIVPPPGGGFERPETRREAFLKPLESVRFGLAHGLLQKLRSGNSEGQAAWIRAHRYHGRLSRFQRPQGLDWRLILAVPDEDVLADPLRRLALVCGGALLFLTLFALQVRQLSRKLGHPLAQLAGAAEGLGRGEPPVLPSTEVREIRSLGRALEDSHAALQEREVLQDQLRQAQKLETVGTLAGGIAHDVNNQLMAVLGQLDLGLECLADPHPARSHLQRAGDAARRCAETARALLAFSRSSPATRIPVDLNAVVDEALLLMGKVVGTRIAFQVDCAELLPPVLGDRVQLEQVLVNLVMNARDAMPEGGRIRVATRPLGTGEVELEVQDDGMGMVPEQLTRIFEPFYTTKAHGEGTGLGLSMVLGIVQAHQGRIEVESQPGRGSRFRITLPPSPAGVLQEPAPTNNRLPERLDGLRLLLAEDEPTIRETVATALARKGAQVTEAPDGETAWAHFQAGAYDAVITDQLMPGCTGLELVDRIRAQQPRLPIILASGFGLEGLEDRLAADPALTLLPKPFPLTVLVEKLQGLQHGPGTLEG